MNLTLNKSHLDFYLFGLLIIIYAVFSSMIPAKLSLFEVLIGLILFTLSFRNFFVFFQPIKIADRYEFKLRILVAYFFFVPFIVGITNFNEIRDIIRDILPLLFFLLPIFLLKKIKESPQKWFLAFALGLTFTGLIMALRHFLGSSASFSSIGKEVIFVDEGISLANDPAVLFAAIFLFGFGLFQLGNNKFIYGFICIILALVPSIALFAVAARAPSALLLLSIFIFIVLNIIYSQNRVFISTISFSFISIIVLINLDVLIGLYDILVYKHENFGNSVREIELATSITYTFKDIFTSFFGGGWGSLIPHPLANGGAWSFIHNMYGYFLFKTGIIGLIFLAIYLAWIVKISFVYLLNIYSLTFIALVSSIPPLMVNSIFEVGYKTLPFGLIICLIVAGYYLTLNNKKSALD